MTLTNKVMLAGLMMTAFTGYTWGIMSHDFFRLDIETTVTAPTCEVTAPTEHSLGVMVRNSQTSHKPLAVTWTCGNRANAASIENTYLTAEAVNSSRDDNDQKMYFSNKSDLTQNTATLSLKADEKYIKFNGEDKFCATSGSSGSCVITPVTDVPQTAQAGQVYAIVKFVANYQ